MLADSLSLVLSGGTTYWVAEESAGRFNGTWPMNTTGATSVDSDLIRGGTDVLSSGAFQVLSTASSNNAGARHLRTSTDRGLNHAGRFTASFEDPGTRQPTV